MEIYKVILIIMILPVYIYMYYRYYKTTIYENGRIMFLKIPYENKDDENIKIIVKKSQDLIKLFCILNIIFSIVYFVFVDYFFNSFFVISLMILLIGPLNIMMIFLNREYERLKKLKTEKNWISYPDYNMFLDTRIVTSGLDKKYNRLLTINFIATLIILTVYFLLKDRIELYYAILLIFNFNIVNLFSILQVKSDRYIYIGEDYEGNYNINKEKIDKNFSLIKYLIFIEFIIVIAYFIIGSISKYYIEYFVFFVAIQIIIWLIYFWIFYKINKKYISKENDVFEMGDFYNYYGYNNPYDSRTSVPSPIMNTKMEANTGNLKGKLYSYLSNLFLIIILIGSTIYLNNSINAKFNYDLDSIQLKINVDIYNKTIDYKNIKEIELYKDDIVIGGKRIYGNAMENYLSGKFYLEDFGEVWLFTQKAVSENIVIKTEKEIFVFNDVDKEKTERLYKEINEKIATIN